MKGKKKICVEIEKKIFCTSHQQTMFGHVLGSKASICVVVAQEDKCFHNKSFFLLLPHLALITKHNIIWYVISLWSVQVICPGCVSTTTTYCPPPAYWPLKGWMGCRDILYSVPALVSNCGEISRRFQLQMQSTVLYDYASSSLRKAGEWCDFLTKALLKQYGWISTLKGCTGNANYFMAVAKSVRGLQCHESLCNYPRMFTFGHGVVWLSFLVGCFLAHACLALAVRIYYNAKDTTGQSLGKIN